MIPIFKEEKTRKQSFRDSVFICICIIVLGVVYIMLYPRAIACCDVIDGIVLGLDTTRCTITIDRKVNYHDTIFHLQKSYKFPRKDLSEILRFMPTKESNCVVSVRILAEKNHARQIEMNGIIVKKYDVWKYAQPALWLMILPGTICLLYQIINRKRLMKDAEPKN